MRKPLTILFSAALALAMLPASAFAAPDTQPDADAPLAAQAADTATMYRLYNPNSGEHFYTASPVERQAVIDAGWDDEGDGWTAPTEGVQVYRLYNSFAGEHHYTTSPEERDMLVSVGWTWEEGGWCSDIDEGVPLYRAYNPNAYANNHHYTTDWGEFQTLLSLGWQDEGIGWYGVDPVSIVKQYSYSIKPVNGSLNKLFFVETDNPDPESFVLVDTNSKYLGAGEFTNILPDTTTYEDVTYSNADTLRISDKGYLFRNYGETDGGPLELRASSSYDENTGVIVDCAAVEDGADYLIHTYASEPAGFFGKLDAVQDALSEIAIYPAGVSDTSKPLEERSYPCLAKSPYSELGLNEHIERAYSEGNPLLIDSAYGFVLDSLGFPGMMISVAEKLDSACEVSSGSTHAYVNISLNGRSEQYGGAGQGTGNPIYTQFVEKTFKFDGTDQGYGTNSSMDTLRAKRLEYGAKSDEFSKSLIDKLSFDSIAKVVGDGAWISVACEGTDSTALAYAAYGSTGPAEIASDAWVDGRYVNNHEVYEPDAKFADHPNADIILHGVTYTDRYDVTRTTSVYYAYDRDEDYWRAFDYYNRDYGYWLGDIDKFPDSLKLTRAQVDAMVKSGQIDGNTSTPPTPKYIYDGTAEPGTPCN